jgi:uncharacterized protein (TIGR02646 family)
LIRVNKPTTIPAKLVTDGKNKRRSHSQSYTRNPDAYTSGDKKFPFDSKIYADPNVKQALIEAQHSKCCFCEFLIGTDGDVEHFRPKQAYKQKIRQSLQRPGYYWLAYEWDNLYLSCSSCNQRHKQNLFPLQNPTQRAKNHNQNIDHEQPLLIDPGKENPEEFIGFRVEFPFAIEENSKGEETIKALKLGERALPEAKLGQLQRLKALHKIVCKASQNPGNIELQECAIEAKHQLENAVKDQAEFAAAARWAIKTDFQYVIG